MNAWLLVCLALVGVILFFCGMKPFVTRAPDSEARDRLGCLLTIVGLVLAVASGFELLARLLAWMINPEQMP